MTSIIFVHDNQYSVTSAVNRVNREVVERYRYSPYGETTVLTHEFNPKTDNTLENEYTYTGRRLDPSGLMYFRARYYHPQLGQFISRDPLGYVATTRTVHQPRSARIRRWHEPISCIFRAGGNGSKWRYCLCRYL